LILRHPPENILITVNKKIKLRKPSLLLDICESNCDNKTQFVLFFGIVPQTTG